MREKPEWRLAFAEGADGLEVRVRGEDVCVVEDGAFGAAPELGFELGVGGFADTETDEEEGRDERDDG